MGCFVVSGALGAEGDQDALPKEAVKAQVISSRAEVELRLRIQLNKALISVGDPRICLIPKPVGDVPFEREPAGGWRSIGESNWSFTSLGRVGRSGALFAGGKSIREEALEGDGEVEMLMQIGLFKQGGGSFYLKPQPLSLVRSEGIWTLQSEWVSPLGPPVDNKVREKYGARTAKLGEAHTTGTRSAIREVVLAGDGKFLVLRLAEEPCIAVYDIGAGKIVREMSAGSTDCTVAANREAIFAAVGSPPQIVRWNLLTGEKSAAVPVAGVERINAIAAGWRSRDTPIAVAAKSRLLFLNPGDLQPSMYSMRPFDQQTEFGDPYFYYRRTMKSTAMEQDLLASGDGLEFVHTVSGSSGLSLRLRNGDVAVRKVGEARHREGGRLDARGDFFFYPRGASHLRQRHSFESGREAEAMSAEYRANGGVRGDALIPIPSGDVFLSMSRWGKDYERPTVVLSPLDDRDKVLLAFDSFDEMVQRPAMGPRSPQRYWLLPSSKKIVTIPADNRRIVARGFDLAAALRKAGDLRHVILSAPRSTAARGSVYTYRIALLDAERRPRYNLRTAPDGTKLTNAGFAWPVPETQGGGAVDFQIDLTVEGEREHHFKVDVVGINPVVAAPAPGDPPAGEGQNLSIQTKVLKTGMLADRPVLGGSGRYMIFRTIDPPGVVVVDVDAMAISKRTAFAEREFQLAANHDSLFRLIADQNLLELRKLPDLTRVKVVRVPVGSKLIAAGSHSRDQPLLLIGRRDLLRVDPRTLELELLKFDEDDQRVLERNWVIESMFPYSIACSADGRLFTSWTRSVSRAMVRWLHFDDGPKIGTLPNDEAVLPDPRGHLLFGRRGGIYRMPGFELLPQKWPIAPRPLLVAGGEGNYFMAVDSPSSYTQNVEQTAISFYDTTVMGKILTLTEFPEMDERADRMRRQDPKWSPPDPRDAGDTGFCLADRFHLLRSGTRLITIPYQNDRLVVRMLDFEKELKGLERPYLWVKSAPPVRVRAGESYRWQAEIAASGGDPRVTTLDVPKGMGVSPEGLVEWSPDAGHPPGPVQVLLEIRDSSGQSGYYSFAIDVQKPKPSPPAP